MRHRTASWLMSIQMDRPLCPKEESGLLQHVEQCARCQATWSAMLKAGHLLSQLSWLDPPPGLPERVRERFPSSRRAVVAPAPVWARASLMVAGALALLLVGLAVGALLIETVLGKSDWALVRKENWGVLVSAWQGAAHLLSAFGTAVRALWEGLWWPWLPLFLLALACAGVLWAWLWRRVGHRTTK